MNSVNPIEVYYAMEFVNAAYRAMYDEYVAEYPDNSFVAQVEHLMAMSGLWPHYLDYLEGRGINIDE